LQLAIKKQPWTTLLVYFTSLKFLGAVNWKRKKHQPEYRDQWRKLRAGIDTQTL